MPGFILQICGLQHKFATAGATSPSLSSPDGAWDTTITTLENSLVTPRGWSERTNPTTGELDVSGMTFQVHDVVPSTGLAAGFPVMTWLNSWDEEDVTQTFLGVSADANDTTFTVDSTAGFSASGVFWIEGEAVAYSGKTGTTFTGCTRGYYASFARGHRVADESRYRPVVFAQPAWITRRRAILWHVDGDGVARIAWLGYASRPRLGQTLGLWEIACDHAHTINKAVPLGVSDAVTTLRGFDRRTISLDYHEDGLQVLSSRSVQATDALSVFDTLDVAVQAVVTEVCNNVGTALTRTVAPVVRLTADGLLVQVATVESGAGVPFKLTLRLGDKEHTAESRSIDSFTELCELRIAEIPSALVYVRHGVYADYPVSSTRGLPLTAGSPDWPVYSGLTEGTYETRTELAMVGEYDDGNILEIYGIPTGSSGYSRTGSTINGLGTVIPVNQAWRQAYPMRAAWRIDRPLELRQALRIRTDHFLVGLRWGLLTEWDAFDIGVVPDDYDWARLLETVSARDSVLCSVLWRLYGQTNIGEIAGDAFALHGLGFGIQDGRIGPFAFRLPNADEAPVIAFTPSDFVRGQLPTYSTADILVNSVEITTAQYKAIVQDQGSIARYGVAPRRQIDASSLFGPGRGSVSPAEVRNTLLQSYFGLWAFPVRKVSLPVSLEHIWDVWHGDFVSYTDPRLPAGDGTRGAVARLVQVCEREVVNDGNGVAYLRLTCLDYGGRTAVRYAPCMRVESISGQVAMAATEYIDPNGQTTDYTGGDNASGAGYFVAGDRVELVERDATGPLTPESLIIDTVNATIYPYSVTFTTSPSTDWQDKIDLGGIVDLRFDGYATSGLQAAQKTWGWVGDETNGVIAGTADKAKRWAP